MARYTGPKTRVCRIFGQPVLGNPKKDVSKLNPPGQHGRNARRKSVSEYAIQLKEKQKAKYMYGVLERQFRNIFAEAARKKGSTGENLIQLLEARLDNTVYRLGMAASRPAARQLVSHKHITVNGQVVNIPSYVLKPGDVIGLKLKSAHNRALTSVVTGKSRQVSWLDWDQVAYKGVFLSYPEPESFPDIKVQLIVELYSK